jgi:hypothetical protein
MKELAAEDKLAKKEFENLGLAEIELLQAVETGEEAVARSACIISATLIEWLCTDPSAVAKVHRHGVALRAYQISGLLNLIHAEIRFPLQFHQCSFDSRYLAEGRPPEITEPEGKQTARNECRLGCD